MKKIIFYTTFCVIVLTIMNASDNAQESKDKAKVNSQNIETQKTILSQYKVGQVWSYKTRLNEHESSFIVIKVDSNSEYGNIISIALRNLKIKNPGSPDGFTNAINHLPFTEKAIDKSAVKLRRESEDVTDFQKGYNLWKESFNVGRAGVYTITIAEVVDSIEEVFNPRKETFLISSEMKPQWVSIEYDNPKCEPLKDYNEKNLTINIPLSGFLCTSSPSYKGAYQRSYFLVDKKGNREILTDRENIRREGVLSKSEPSLDEGQPNCNVKLHQFYYGSEDEIRKEGANPIFQDENFLVNYHPECRNTGTSFPKKEF